MSGVNIPTDSTHLSGVPSSQMVEQFIGAVDTQYAETSILRQVLNVRRVVNTDTLMARRLGATTVQAITPGVRPATTVAGTGTVTVKVDTTLIVRNNQSLLGDFQTDFNIRNEIGIDQGKELGIQFDRAGFIQCVKGAGSAAPANLNNAIGAGKVETLAAVNDDMNPDLLYSRIEAVLTRMETEEIRINECLIFVSPRHAAVLRGNDKLINKDYSTGKGDFAQGTLGMAMGCRVVSTPRIPNAAITGHPLSNADNSNAYDLTADEAKVVAIILHPDGLLTGETIGITSSIHFDQTEKQWFIDSYNAFGMSVRRPDCCGIVKTV